MHPLLISAIVLALLVVIALATGCGGLLAKQARAVPADRTETTDLYAFTLTATDGSAYPLAQHRGQVVLLVNTASKCGLTGQYDGLEALWQRYRDEGLVVIAQPSNDFLGQEPGSNDEIAQFCRLNYGVTFPLMAKQTVNGDDKAPLYRYLTEGSSLPGKIAWNFEKFLIGRDGHLRHRFSPRIKPDDPKVIAAIELALGEAQGDAKK